MNIEFTALNQAIEYTIKYYDIDRIGEYFKRYEYEPDLKIISGGSMNKDAFKWEDVTLNLHSKMESEIVQNNIGSNDIILSYLYNTLKDWLEDVRIKIINRQYIIDVIEDFNKKRLADFLLKVEQSEEKFRLTEEYNTRKHFEVYQEEFRPYAFMKDYPISLITQKRTITYFRFLCPAHPELIDIRYLDKYIDIITPIIVNFRNIINKHLVMYERGEFKKGITFQSAQAQVLIENKITQPKKLENKLKANLSVEQIAYLFKLLSDAKIIESPLYKNIHEFISANFNVLTKKDNEQISTGKIAKLWNNFDAKTSAFWMDKFIDLHNQAKKDNPNNIKITNS